MRISLSRSPGTDDAGVIDDPSEPAPPPRRIAGRTRAQFQAAARAHLLAARTAELPSRATKPPGFERALWGLHDAQRAGERDGAAEGQRGDVDGPDVPAGGSAAEGGWPSLRPWFAKMLANTEAELEAVAPDERWLWQIDIAIARENLGDAAVLADELVGASDWFAQLCAELRVLVDARPAHDGLGDRLLRAYDKATHVAICLGRFEEAHGWLEHALEVVAAAPRALRWQQAAWLRVYATLGNVAVALERPRDAAAWFDCAIEASRWLHAREGWSGWHHALCVALVARAEVAGDVAEAVPLLREVRKLVGYHLAHDVTSAEDRALLAERIAALWYVRSARSERG